MICTKHDLDYFADEGCPVCKLEAMSDEEFNAQFTKLLDEANTIIDELKQFLKVERAEALLEDDGQPDEAKEWFDYDPDA
jgi:hypothetical protein